MDGQKAFSFHNKFLVNEADFHWDKSCTLTLRLEQIWFGEFFLRSV